MNVHPIEKFATNRWNRTQNSSRGALTKKGLALSLNEATDIDKDALSQLEQ